MVLLVVALDIGQFGPSAYIPEDGQEVACNVHYSGRFDTGNYSHNSSYGIRPVVTVPRDVFSNP